MGETVLYTGPSFNYPVNDEVLAITDLTISDIASALRRNSGNLLYTARELGIERSLLKRKIEHFPSLNTLFNDLREELLDEAEYQLLHLVREGSFPAISLVLKTLGRGRGYSDKWEGSLELGENAASLIEAMKKGAKEIETIDLEEYEWTPVKSEV